MSKVHKLENSLPDPLITEISSLKAALARYQAAADTANIHLQHQALDLSTLAARCNALEQENNLLQKEIAFLRSNPESSASSSSASLQMSEMTLVMRRLSDQLDSSEEAFRNQAEQLIRARNAASQAKLEAKGAHELAARSRVREMQAQESIRALEFDLKKKEEERKMADLVVREYADLVRTIEGRSSLASPPTSGLSSFASERKQGTTLFPIGHIGGRSSHPRDSSDGSSDTLFSQEAVPVNGDATAASVSNTHVKPIDSLHEGRAGLQRLLAEFHEQTERLEEEISKLHGEKEVIEMKLGVCEQLAADEHQELAIIKAELDSALRADKSAAKMVERYMSFSQQSTNLLQAALQTQKKRHAATTETFERQILAASAVAEREKGISARLRATLDDMTIEISRESFGRRRETSIRLSLAERERKIGVMLEKWLNNMEQKGASAEEAVAEEDHAGHVSVAKQILRAIHGPSQEASTTGREESKIQMALAAVEEFLKELEAESSRRLLLERENADLRRIQVAPTDNAEELPPDSGTPSENPRSEGILDMNTVPPISDTYQEANTPDVASKSTEETVIPSLRSTRELQPSLSRIIGQHETKDALIPLQTPEHPSQAIRRSKGATLPVQPVETREPEQVDEKISSLRETSRRYSALQSAFSDCHDALLALQPSLGEDGVVPTESHLIAAVERLHDYCEDARVELEILAADEARIAQGYETLLSLLSQERPLSSRDEVSGDEGQLLDRKIDAFVKGTLPSMEKARALFEGKLDNLMHDIAIIKRAMHEELDPAESEVPSTSQVSNSPPTAHANGITFPSQSSNYDEDTIGNDAGPNQLTWKTLASSLIPSSPLSGTSTSSPGSRPAQTFGSLMTSGRPRYPSTGKYNPKSRGMGIQSDSNPLNHLGLRIAMPRVPSSQGENTFPSSFNIHSPFPFALRPAEATLNGSEIQPNSAPISRAGSGWFSPGGISRARTISNIHSVGFGVGMAISPRHALDKTRNGAGSVRSETHVGLTMGKARDGESALAESGGRRYPSSEQEEVE